MNIIQTAVLAVLCALTEDGKPPEKKDLIKELKDIKELMSKSEEYLHEALKGSDKRHLDRVLEKYNKLKFKNPELELPPALLDESGKEQKRALEKMKDLVKFIESIPKKMSPSSGSGSGKSPGGGQSQPEQKQDQKEMQKEEPGGSPAKQPYNPNKPDPLSRFKDIKGNVVQWGLLPPKERERISRELDNLERYPARYREHIRAYLKKLASIKEK